LGGGLMDILTSGFESIVRSKLGVDIYDLPDSEINNSRFPEQAELIVKRRVPDYASITDDADRFFLENAVINYICYLLCPSLSRRLNIEVKTLDTSWKKDKIDWIEFAELFLNKFEEDLLNIQTVQVINIESTLVDKVSFEYTPIGS
jgi:hypothetical protein